MPSVRDTPTRLLAEFGAPSGSHETERARDIMLRLGGANVIAHQPGQVQVVEGIFDNVWDATNAIVQIVEEASRWRLDEDPLTGIRMSLCTPLAGQNTPELAEQLLSRVGPGQILANAAAAVVAGPMLPQRIHLVDRGLWAPAPGQEPERVYELRLVCSGNGASQRPSNLEWARRAVGHDVAVSANLTELTATWQVALTGKRRMVLLTSQPGQGSAGAAAELALRAHSEGALVLYGRWDGDDSKPYQAIRESLAVYASGCTTEKLRVDLEGMAAQIATLLPEVAARVSGTKLTQHSPVARARMFEAVERWLIMIVRQEPTLLVLDDVQNAESSSLDLLAQLWHALRQSRIMIVVAGSDSGQPSPALARVLDLGAHTEPGAFERMRLKPSR